MATRYGGYCYEDNLEEMTIDKLQALKEVCDYTIKEKRREEIHKALTKINLLAHTYGFDICVYDSDDYPQVMTEYSMVIKDRE